MVPQVACSYNRVHNVYIRPTRHSWPSATMTYTVYIYVTQGIEDSFSSVGEEDAGNRDSCSKVHRPPGVGFRPRSEAAVVQFLGVCVLVAVHRPRRPVRAVREVRVGTGVERRSLERHVQTSIHCISCNSNLIESRVPTAGSVAIVLSSHLNKTVNSISYEKLYK